MIDETLIEARALLRRAKETEWSAAQVNAYWDSRDGSHYGDDMASWIPDYSRAHELLLNTLSAFAKPDLRVLDLGAGNGRVAKMILDRMPGSHVTLVDLPNGMLRAAPDKLAEHNGRFKIIAADMFDERSIFGNTKFDCVVSVFAICHARSVEVYQHLYRRIFRCLNSEGLFICYDHVLGDTQTFTEINVAGWHKFLLQTQSDATAREGVVSTYQEDRPLAMRQHLNLLVQAGFDSADVLFKKDIFAIYAGVKMKSRNDFSPLGRVGD